MSDTLPLSIQNNRRLEKWLRFQPDRTLRLAVGKVELGQGNVTALAQIAAEELDVGLDRITVLSGDTQDAPDEGQTTSSQSIEVSGRSVRLVTAEFRARVVDRLAQRLNCSPGEITVEDGAFHRGDAPTGHDYWTFSADEDFARDIEGTATTKPPSAYRVVGQPIPRRDLPAKVTGARVHPRHGAAGHAARAHPAPAGARCDVGVAERSRGAARRWRRVPHRARRQFRCVRRCRRDGGATRRRRRSAACDVGERADS